MSKELEALKEIMRNTPLAWSEIEDGFVSCKEYETIKSALERLEKLEEVWDKVKDTIFISVGYDEEFKEYYLTIGNRISPITETEFNLLKEMLK